MTVEIRRVGAGDADLFARVSEDVFDEAIDPARLAAYLADAGHLRVVAIADGEIVGQCVAVIHRHPDKATELYIDEIGVCPRVWRQGIATAMMDEMIAWGREHGCADAWLGTGHDNVAANALYRRHASPEGFIMYFWTLES